MSAALMASAEERPCEEAVTCDAHFSDEREQHDDSTAAQKRKSAPFGDLNLSSHEILTRCKRIKCVAGCGKNRRYFCSDCLVPLVAPDEQFPRVELPLFVDILQSGAEVPQRSTAQHVPLLAPGFSKVWRPFPECAQDFSDHVLKDRPHGSVAVLYPSEDALSPEQAVKCLPKLERIIVMDSSWTKSVLLMQDPCLSKLPRLTLPPGKATRFWRYAPKRSEHSQYFSPDKVGSLMSTVESVHRFCEAYNKALGNDPGQCDNLLWIFAFLHARVKQVYEQAPGKRQRIMRKSKGLMSAF